MPVCLQSDLWSDVALPSEMASLEAAINRDWACVLLQGIP